MSIIPDTDQDPLDHGFSKRYDALAAADAARKAWLDAVCLHPGPGRRYQDKGRRDGPTPVPLRPVSLVVRRRGRR